MLVGGSDPAEGPVEKWLLCPQSLPLPGHPLTPFWEWLPASSLYFARCFIWFDIPGLWIYIERYRQNLGTQEPFVYISSLLSLDTVCGVRTREGKAFRGSWFGESFVSLSAHSLFFLTASSKFNSHAINFTHSYSSALLFSLHWVTQLSLQSTWARFHPPKKKAIWNHLPFPPSPQKSSTYFVSANLSVVHRIHEWNPGILSLCMMFARFIRVVACTNTPSLSLAEQYSLTVGRSHCVYPSIRWQTFWIVSTWGPSWTMPQEHLCVVFVWTCVSHSLGQAPGCGPAGLP